MFKSLLSENIFLRTAVITGTVGLFIVSFLMDRSVFALSGNETNKAARIKIVSSSFEKELAGKKAPAGKIFILLETEWENIHPKQKVDKAKLEGKVDRTMGVGGLAGRKKEKKVEYVDADVAYRIKKLIDHVYLLGDGLAYSLDKTTEEISENFRLGVRAQNQVLNLDLSKKPLKGMPEATAVHRDGDVMEVLVFGIRKEQGKQIVDLGLRSLSKRSGLDIQTNQQFFLKVGDKEFKVDSPATASLLFHPPNPFILPPGVALRFELAFNTDDAPTSLRFRGFRSEGVLKF